MNISPPTRQQSEMTRCGTCKVLWRDCKCKPDGRTESIESLFANEHIFPDPERRHTCVFLFHSYQRWSPAQGQGSEDFTLACLPLWEGWYAAWLKPEIDIPMLTSWSEHPVLKCMVRYFNGTCLEGYIDTEGKLFLCIPGVRPPYGKDFDEDRGLVRMAVSVSQGLTIEEIRTASRGTVYGGRSSPNSWRRVSHVVREENNICTVRMLAEKDGDPGIDIKVEMERMEQYVPHMLQEVKWRGRRRFKRQMAREIQRYLHALVERARMNDEGVRFALKRGWLDGLPSPQTLITEVAGEMATLSGHMDVDSSPSDANQTSKENAST